MAQRRAEQTIDDHTGSARTVLDEATRPTMGAVGPDSAVGSHLVDVHDHFRGELAQLRDVLARVREGSAGVGQARSELNAMAIRANNWTLGGICQAHCLSLTQHHTMEDGAIFGHLGRSEPLLRPVLDRLAEEHRAIHGVLEEIDAALVRLASQPDDYSGVTEAIELLTDTVLSHFAYEERELVGPLARFGFYPGQVR